METFDGHQIVHPSNEIQIYSFYESKAFQRGHGEEKKRHFKYNISLRRNLSQCHFVTLLQPLMLL